MNRSPEKSHSVLRQKLPTGCGWRHSQHDIELMHGEWLIGLGDGAEHLRIQFDLVHRNAVVDAQVKLGL